MNEFLSALTALSGWKLALVGGLVLVVWFLPVFVSLIFNRKHTKLIAIACVPAGFSFIAWGGIMLWAFTGKVWEKDKAQPVSS